MKLLGGVWTFTEVGRTGPFASQGVTWRIVIHGYDFITAHSLMNAEQHMDSIHIHTIFLAEFSILPVAVRLSCLPPCQLACHYPYRDILIALSDSSNLRGNNAKVHSRTQSSMLNGVIARVRVRHFTPTTCQLP